MNIFRQISNLLFIFLHLQRFLMKGIHQIKALLGYKQHNKRTNLVVSNKTLTKAEALVLLQSLLNSTVKEAKGDIEFDNVRCGIRTADLQNPIPLENVLYYVLILQNEDTVHVTPMVPSNQEGFADFGGPFIFRNVTSSFKIKANLYVLNFNPRSLDQIKTYFASDPKTPIMDLLGKTVIDVNNIKTKLFTFEHVEGLRHDYDKMISSIHIQHHWPKQYKGFARMGFLRPNGRVLFVKKWCVLQKFVLLCYATPSDEVDRDVLHTLSLKDCISYEETNNILFWEKILKITLQTSESQIELYITADTVEEFKVWKKYFDLVLTTVQRWKIKENENLVRLM